jgi:K+-sensing histidine kinase KdpD
MNRGLAALLVLLAVPQMAQAYVDPGTGAMVWQVAAATMIGCLFYFKRAAAWLRAQAGLRLHKGLGFAFASLYALVASPIALIVFRHHPLPRFSDVFLLGVVLTAYLFTWEPAAYLLVVSLFVSAWVLPPYGSMRVDDFADWYRLMSFAVLSVFLICLITRMKRQPARIEEERPFSMSRAAASGD